MNTRARIALLATGGTIAGTAASATDVTGYTAGTQDAAQLLASVPQAHALAEVHAEQPFRLDSKDMGPAHWLALAHRVQTLLADKRIDGVVITHGTDTMEETACLLDAVLPTHKPVVLTGAMRPASALSADGPMNLLDAVRTAAHPASHGRGVLVCFAQTLFAAFGVRKLHTDRPDAFAGDVLGRIEHGQLHYFSPPPAPRAAQYRLPPPGNALPRVDLLLVGAGSTPDIVPLLLGAGTRGLVLALPGHGSLPDAWEAVVAEASARGVPVIRASRCGTGPVAAMPLDQRLGSGPAGRLSPACARVRLMLTLAAQSE